MTLAVDFGLVTLQRPPWDQRPWPELYQGLLDTAALVERSGFDGLWVSEHHVTDDGYLSALFPVLGAVAARTERMALGTNVALAPLYHPLRLAEDAAAVQHLSGGRLLLGLAIGYRDEEFETFGVPRRERVPRLKEAVATCRDVGGTGLPIWLGGWVDAGVERAGRLADGYISPAGGVADTRRRLALLDAAARGRRLPVATATWVAVSASGAVPEPVQRGAGHLLAQYRRWYGSSSDHGGGRAVAARLPDEPGLVAGTPAQVVSRLVTLAGVAADRQHRMVVRLDYPGMTTAEVAAHVRLFAAEVLPGLRAAAPG